MTCAVIYLLMPSYCAIISRMSKNQKSLRNYNRLESSQGNHLDEKWLRQKYLDEGLSTYQIAAIVGRDPKRVYEKLRDFGIPTRSRAETVQANAWWAIGKPPRTGWKHSAEAKRKLRDKATGRTGLVGEKNPMFGKRGEQTPNWKGGATPERQALYSTTEWKALIKYIYARDEYTCQRCGSGHNRSNKLHAHHIKSWAEHQELRADPNNLITVCNECHQWIHSNKNTNAEFIA